MWCRQRDSQPGIAWSPCHTRHTAVIGYNGLRPDKTTPWAGLTPDPCEKGETFAKRITGQAVPGYNARFNCWLLQKEGEGARGCVALRLRPRWQACNLQNTHFCLRKYYNNCASWQSTIGFGGFFWVCVRVFWLAYLQSCVMLGIHQSGPRGGWVHEEEEKTKSMRSSIGVK